MGRGSWVVRRASCVMAHASLRRLLLVEFKGKTLRIHEKDSPIKFCKAHSALLMKSTSVQEITSG